jgi:zinc and cadmium transporter
MGTLGAVALYSGIIFLGAIGGAAIPLLTNRNDWLIPFLAFAAGVMFGAAFFHMLPEAYRSGGYAAFTWLPLGFALLFVLERYVLAHACEEPPGFATHGHGPMGLTAFLGLSVHTLFDGVALGSSALESVGLSAFIAIAAHKVPASVSLASILRSEGRSRRATLVFAGIFGLMVPVGAALYLLFSHVVPVEKVAPRALAFSAGTFLYIAVSDLLPHVNRHKEGSRLVQVGSFIVGLAAMFLVGAIAREP